MTLIKDGEYTNTAFETLTEQLEEMACPTCSGGGMCDDAECGDIGYNEWICKTCAGTGFKKGATLKLELT